MSLSYDHHVTRCGTFHCYSWSLTYSTYATSIYALKYIILTHRPHHSPVEAIVNCFAVFCISNNFLSANTVDSPIMTNITRSTIPRNIQAIPSPIWTPPNTLTPENGKCSSFLTSTPSTSRIPFIFYVLKIVTYTRAGSISSRKSLQKCPFIIFFQKASKRVLLSTTKTMSDF